MSRFLTILFISLFIVPLNFAVGNDLEEKDTASTWVVDFFDDIPGLNTCCEEGQMEGSCAA